MRISQLKQTDTYAGIPTLPLGILSNCSQHENSRKVLRQYNDDFLNKKMPHKEAVERARRLSLRLKAEEESAASSGLKQPDSSGLKSP